MSRRAKILILVILPVLALGTLYLRTLVRRGFLAPAAPAEPAVRARLSQAALESGNTATQAAVLYFPSYAEGKLRAESRSLALASSDTDRIREVLLALLRGSSEGHDAPLPASTEVRAVFLTADGTAYLDLSGANLAELEPGIESETLAVYSLVDSLAANIPAVKRVKILVQGQEAETLDGHVDLTNFFEPDPNCIAAAAP
jgi:spore germination protein GerM